MSDEQFDQNQLSLMGGVSFLDPDLVGDEKRAVVLKSAKKNTGALTLNQLLEAVEGGDKEGVKMAAEALKERPGGGWMKRITKALVATKPFNPEIADVLDQHQVITNHLLLTVVSEQTDYDPVPWMLSSVERIKLAESTVGRMPYQGHRKSVENIVDAMVRLGQLEGAVKLDIGTILRGRKSKNSMIEGGRWVVHAAEKTNKNKWAGHFIEKMLSSETIGKIMDSKNEHVIHEQRLYICNQLVQNIGYKSLDDLAGVERAMRNSPTLATAWNDYWSLEAGTLPDNVIYRFMPLRFTNITQRMEIDISSTNDPLEHLLLRGNPAILDALSKKGPLPEALYQRLLTGNGHQVHVVVSHAKSEDILPLITHLMGRMGLDWKDSMGRGWGHALTQASENINVKHIQSFIRDPNGIKLLTTPDHRGKTAIELLGDHPKFKDSQAFLARAKRNLLGLVVAKGGGSGAPRSRPTM